MWVNCLHCGHTETHKHPRRHQIAQKKLEIKNFKIEEIHPYENNPRFNKDAVDKVANSIKKFGFKNPILVDKNMVIIAGHTRLEAAKKLKLKEVPVIIADDLDEKHAKALRLVILPDYQGVGFGTRFLTCVADMYKRKGFDFRITTTAKNLVASLQRRNNWKCFFYGRTDFKSSKTFDKQLARSARKVTITQFMYIGNKTA